LDQHELSAESIIEKISTVLPAISEVATQATTIRDIEAELSLPETDLS
jgi:hypothetical protein